MNPSPTSNQNTRNFGEVDFEDHQIENMEEDCKKVNEEIDKSLK